MTAIITLSLPYYLDLQKDVEYFAGEVERLQANLKELSNFLSQAHERELKPIDLGFLPPEEEVTRFAEDVFEMSTCLAYAIEDFDQDPLD